MTDRSRIRFYLPAWTAAWKRIQGIQAWHLELGSTLAAQLLHQVLDVAAKRPETVRADAVRHACHVVALGSDISSKRMTARQADRCVALFNILADPDDLIATNRWLHPDAADRGRLIYAIERCGLTEAYRKALARDRHGTTEWRTLDLTELRQFSITCRQRALRMGRSAQPA